GKAPMRAAFDGSKEIGFTIISMTVSLVAVFIPVLFMGGIVGRLLHEFAVTTGVAILVSGFVSISLTPMLCSRFLKPPHTQRHGRLYNAFERMFDGWLRLYDWSLRLSLRFRAVTMLVSVVLLAGTVYLFGLIPKGFLPSEDQGRFQISTEAVQGIGFDEMVRHQMQLADIITKDPNVLSFSNNVGGGPGGGGLNTGRISVELKPRSQRKLTVDQLIAKWRPELAQVPGTRVYMVNQPPINLGGQQGARSLYQFTLQDTDTAQLYHWAPIFESKGRESPGIEYVTRVRADAGPLTVSHAGQLPSVTISFNLKPDLALGDAVAAVQNAAATTLPSTIATTVQGTAQAFQESLRGLGLILLMAIVVIY